MIDEKILAAVTELARAAYRMGAKDARHLCFHTARRVAMGTNEVDQKVGATRVRDEIKALNPASAMPDFTSAALVALGAPTSAAEVCAECGGTGWLTCRGCLPVPKGKP
jgi:hypothetical protein